MNEIPAPQKFFIYLTWLFAGLMGLAGVVDTLRGAWDFLTVPVALGGTGLIVLFWFAARAYLQRYPWRTNEGQITRLNMGAAVYLFGMIILLWLPQFVRLPQADPDSVVVLTPTPDPRSTATPSASPTPLSFPPEREDETLIVIATFYRTEGVTDVNIHGEIQRGIEEKLTELNVDNVRVEVEPTAVNVTDRERAEALGNQYNASIIIWGADTGVRLVVSFLNLKEPNFDAAQATVSETERTQLARPDAYAQFVVQDLPNQVSFLALFALGQSFFIQGQYEQSITLIQEAIELLTRKDEISDEFELDGAYFRLGWLYQNTDRTASAINNYSHSISLNPQFAATFNNRGLAYAELGEYEKAIADYDRAIALNPELAPAFYNLGNAYYDLGKHEQAIANYDRAIKLNPNFAIAYNNMGRSFRALGEYELAIANYDRAIELNLQDSKVFSNRGNAYADIGEYEKAMADFHHAITLNPQDAIAFSNRGTVYAELNDYERAVADYDEAIKLYPKLAAVFINRASVYVNLDEYQKALTDYDAAIDISPQNYEAYLGRGFVYTALEQHREAIADFRHYLDLYPKSPIRQDVENHILQLESQLERQ